MCPDCNDLMSRLGRKPAVPFEGEPNSAMYNRSFRRRVQLGVIDAVRSAKRLGVKAVGGSNKRRMSERELIRMSSLFDPDWYLLTYPDVARTGTDPLAHYVDHGWREGRDPGPEFETSAYLRANPDVAVTVNGEDETRRGRQLVKGDVVEVDLPTGYKEATVG